MRFLEDIFFDILANRYQSLSHMGPEQIHFYLARKFPSAIYPAIYARPYQIGIPPESSH
jgi:hypothetical protein